MPRTGWFILPAVLFLLAPLVPANPPETKFDIDTALKVQTARRKAADLLNNHEPAKAVEVLEAQLAYINGSREYLLVLRDAYRAYIMQLRLTDQEQLAEKYVNRLKIIDDSPIPVPATVRQPQVIEQFKPPAPPVPVAVVSDPKAPLTPPPESPGPITARAKVNAEDPFHEKFQATTGLARQQAAQTFLTRAETAFSQKNYLEARALFEQAHQNDPASTTATRDKWAYAKLNYVVEQINKVPAQGVAWTELENEVKTAMAMSTSPKLEETAKQLLQEMQGRKGPGAGTVGVEATFAVKHLGKSPQGWEVAETSHFRVYHQQSRDMAEKAAQIADKARREMSRKWFGNDGEAWTPKCEIFLYANAQDYSRLNPKVATSSPGHSAIETDTSGQRVVTRRVHLRLDHPTALVAVLPHETTHVVIAGQYGPYQVPRWADEGVAVLTEPADKIEQHRKNLLGHAQKRELFHVQELMQLPDYPQPARIPVFYAQSVSLVDFLSKQRGPQVFTAFLRDGLRDGYEPSLRKHFGFQSYADLHNRWNQSLSEASPAVAGR